MKLWCDLETYSTVPIKNGTHAYAEQAEILLWAYAIDDGPEQVWDVASGAPIPVDLWWAAREEGAEYWWHNGGMFDRVIVKHAMPELYDVMPADRWRDTIVQALAHSLPGALSALCDVLSIEADDAKDKEGRALIHLFCKPPAKNLKRGRATAATHPAEWAKFIEYAKSDIRAMRAAHKKMPKWNYPNNKQELDLWLLDQEINMRGMAVDLELANAAIRLVDHEKARLSERTAELTGGAVESTRQVSATLAHILDVYNVTLPDMQASTLERRIQDPNLPFALRELLAVRLQASATSSTKYRALINGASSDGRLRGTLQFDGASRTGRWAGRLFQPQNLSRVPKHIAKQWDLAIDSIKHECADLFFTNLMELAGSCVRGAIVAPEGKRLVVADLSNIEGRVLAWLTGEEWKLEAFRAYDRQEGPDLYKLAYAKSFGIKPEAVTDDQRQVSKVQELALGYEGGVGAFLTFAAAYGIDLEAMGALAFSTLPADIREESNGFYDWMVKQKRPTFGLTRRAFVVCDGFKRSWRAAHPATVNFWKELGDAVIAATNNKGVVFDVRMLRVRCDGAWLRIRLPSGRFLCYPAPKIEDGKWSYMGIDQYSRQWQRVYSYSGKIAENVTQAVARDVIAHGMTLADQHGYTPITSIHDEVPCETPDTEDFNTDGLCALLATNPDWCPDLPLAAAGFQANRYRKG